MKLPVIRITCLSKNPNWVLDTNLPYEERMKDYDIVHETDAEILTIHLEKSSMRIRYKDACGKTRTRDMGASSFFEKYDIIRK